MLNTIKDLLFHTLIIIGMVALIATVIWWFLVVLNRVFKFTKTIIMYRQYKRNEELYNIKNEVIVSKNGHILYSCISGLDEQIKILNKAIERIEDTKRLREKYGKRGSNDDRY